MNPKPRSPQRPGLISSVILTPGHLPLVNSTPARLGLMWNYAVASAFKSRRLHPGAPTTQSEPALLPASRAFLLREECKRRFVFVVHANAYLESGSTKLNTVASAASNARRLRSAPLFRGHQVVLNPRHAAHVVETMRGLMQTTRRIRRGWPDRLKGYDRLFETELTDGQHTVYGRGRTSEASQRSAQRNWEAEFGQEPES